MRFASTTLGLPTAGGGAAVTPAVGAFFALSTPTVSSSGQQALETFLGCLFNGLCFGASIVGTAAAANKAVAELNNPAASGKNIYVYSVDVFVPAAMAVNAFIDGTTLTPVGTGVNLKTGVAVGVAKVGGGNQLATTGSLFYTSPTLAINADYAIPQPWLLEIQAGHNLQLQGQTVNQAFTANVRWIELSQ